jgi:hypothetical protein
MAVMLKSKTKTSTEVLLQLSITLALMYISNKLSVDIWRSMTGH